MTIKEALDLQSDPEQMRIRAVEADGWKLAEGITYEGKPVWRREDEFAARDARHYPLTQVAQLPLYPTSFDALYTAEERLGIHNRANLEMRVFWINTLHKILEDQPDSPKNNQGRPLVSDIDKMTCRPELRCLAFIMTAEKFRP